MRTLYFRRMATWSLQQVEQLAPDAAAFKAAQGTAKPAKWSNLGCNERHVWGECQGSGSNPYQVRADLIELAYKCSCPSRKLPCKHTLALLVLMANGAVPPGTPLAFVEEWAGNRAKRAEAKQNREAQASAAEPDPEARAKRIEKRENRIGAGLDQLQTWIADIVGQGLAATRGQGTGLWTQMAARLVDAQAPGLARRVRELGDRAVASPDWQSELLAGLARLWPDRQPLHWRDRLGTDRRWQRRPQPPDHAGGALSHCDGAAVRGRAVPAAECGGFD